MFPLYVAVVEGVCEDHNQERNAQVNALNDGVDTNTICGRKANFVSN